jgi:hypothetical protein
MNEVRILESEGRQGHELVAVGLLSLTFRPTDSAWEYRRVVAISKETAAARLEGAGWIYVTGWFPFHYFKRSGAALGTAA